MAEGITSGSGDQRTVEGAGPVHLPDFLIGRDGPNMTKPWGNLDSWRVATDFVEIIPAVFA